MGLADLHIHSIFSYDGTSSISAILKHTKDNTSLNVIAITDHDSMDGVKEALELAPRYNLEVIPGCEVSTAEGHLITLYVDRPVKAGLSLVETVRRVGDMGGLCIAAHPMARGVSSLHFEAIRKALTYPEVADVLVGIEAFNGGLVYTRKNPLIAAVARTFPLTQIGSSDAHVLNMIGQGATVFPGKTAFELRAALELSCTEVREGKGFNGFEVVMHYLPRFIFRKLGWVAWNAYPQAPVVYTRLSKTMSQSYNSAN